jgi:hypothetical protein
LRKTIDITIPDEGRDKGKVFRITEMPSAQAEKWAIRALMSLMKANPDLPKGFERQGMAGLAKFGLEAFARLDYYEVEPLLDEMWQCITIVPSTNVVRPMIPDDIEEVTTRLMLRAEVFKLHTDFLLGAGSSTLTQAPTSQPEPVSSPAAPTSPRVLRRSSVAGRRP